MVGNAEEKEDADEEATEYVGNEEEADAKAEAEADDDDAPYVELIALVF